MKPCFKIWLHPGSEIRCFDGATISSGPQYQFLLSSDECELNDQETEFTLKNVKTYFIDQLAPVAFLPEAQVLVSHVQKTELVQVLSADFSGLQVSRG